MRQVTMRCLTGFSAEESAVLTALLRRALDNAALDDASEGQE
jgi:hypothetical protein